MSSSIVLTRSVAPSISIVGETPTIMPINGQPTSTFSDLSRNGKILSVVDDTYIFSRNALNDLDWFHIDGATHSNSGYIMKFDGTICFSSGHCENTDDREMEIRVYVDDTDVGAIGILSGGEDATFINTTLNIDYLRGQRIRLRAIAVQNSVAGNIQDTIISLTIKHRVINS